MKHFITLIAIILSLIIPHALAKEMTYADYYFIFTDCKTAPMPLYDMKKKDFQIITGDLYTAECFRGKNKHITCNYVDVKDTKTYAIEEFKITAESSMMLMLQTDNGSTRIEASPTEHVTTTTSINYVQNPKGFVVMSKICRGTFFTGTELAVIQKNKQKK